MLNGRPFRCSARCRTACSVRRSGHDEKITDGDHVEYEQTEPEATCGRIIAGIEVFEVIV